jgi:hypothetical protein
LPSPIKATVNSAGDFIADPQPSSGVAEMTTPNNPMFIRIAKVGFGRALSVRLWLSINY